MQRVFEMYQDLGFTVLAINVEPEQRRLVAPVMTALGVGFVSLQGDWKWAEQNYGVKIHPWYGVRDDRPFFEAPYLGHMFLAHDLASASKITLNRGVDTLPL